MKENHYMTNETIRESQILLQRILQTYISKLSQKIGNGDNIFDDFISVAKSKDAISLLATVNVVYEKELKANPINPDELLEEI
jgi:hypothetical protein